MKENSMNKACFSEHQIIAVIKSVEAGRTVKDVCREVDLRQLNVLIRWSRGF
ncbi:TPA: transposase [Escherichia coli]|nr:hypothetical protein [Escherichia coli]EFB1318492.1 hypothetical protein [Escherichia coli]EFJ3290560.1 transposase [Escherichia coli]EFN7001932.1 hypothetical protein [Escherichia coli]EFO3763116.1 hypothetical protein [Escherichia coli]